MGEQDKECRCPPSSLPADLQAFPRTASHQSRKNKGFFRKQRQSRTATWKFIFLGLISGLKEMLLSL